MGHNQFMFVYSDIVNETCLIFVFSMLSLMSQLGILCLGISFFSNSLAQRLATLFMLKSCNVDQQSSALSNLFELQTNRNGTVTKREVRLKEDDILRAARVVLPAVNFTISKARELFSGEPSMTLKVNP